ncbi:MAG: preprotein translocase subunit SecE [Clostridiales bacterium]|nr:preprotein translocase subunit SecE [Clostridiales bacterium]
MADNKKKPNIFKRIAQKFNDVRLELKRVIWPTKEKLVQTSAVVLVVIAVCAILLTAIGKGAGWVLEKVGFYDQVTETTESTTAMSLEGYTVPTTTADPNAETTASSDAETSASEAETTAETTAPSET